MVKYMELMEDLETTLNFNSTNELKAKENKRVFNYCLMTLKDDFKIDVSTKFLMGFVKGDDKQKSNRVNYLLKQVGLTERKSILMNNANFNLFSHEKKTNDLITHEDLFDSVKIFKSVTDKDGNEKITCKLIKLTSHDLNGSRHDCKVGTMVYKNQVYRHYNQIVL